MKKTIAVLFVALMLSGCATVGGWRWMAVASTRSLRVGMSRAELQRVMPYPSDINITQTAAGKREQICWNTRPTGSQYYQPSPIFVYVENGVVIGWQG